MEIKLLNTLVIVFCSYVILVINSRQVKTLSDEFKVKLFEINLAVRKTYALALCIVFLLFYIVAKLDLFEFYIPLTIILLLVLISTMFFTSWKIKKGGLPPAYVRRVRLSQLAIICVAIMLICGNYYFSTASGKTKEDYEFDAQYEMTKKNYQKALEYYNQAIQLDSVDAMNLNNRACCKYYVRDTVGACLDWKKSEKLGGQEAVKNLVLFCN